MSKFWKICVVKPAKAKKKVICKVRRNIMVGIQIKNTRWEI